MIYLDNAASTAVHPEVVKEMLPYFDVQYGNPSSIHQFGRKAKNAIQKHENKLLHLLVPNQPKLYLPQVGLNQIILFSWEFQPSDLNRIMS